MLQRRFSLLVLSIFLLPGLVFQGAARADDEVDQAIEGSQDILTQRREILIIEGRIAESKRKIEQLRSEQNSLANQISLLDEEHNKTQLEVDAAQGQLDQVNQDITETDAEIVQTEGRLENQILVFQENLNETYILGRTSIFEVMVTADSLSDLVRRIEYSEIVDEQNQNILGDIQTLKEQLESQRSALESRKQQVETLKEEVENKRRQVEQQRIAKAGLLNETRGLEENYQSVIDENIRARRQLDNEINSRIQQIEADIRRRREEERRRLEEERRRLEAEGQDSSKVSDQINQQQTPSRQGYIWPTRGRITTYFWQSYPDWMLNAFPWLKQGNYRYHTGLDIAAPTGTTVVAPKAGQIVMVRDYGNYSYGKALVMDHQDGTVTLYGHLNSFAVSEGQQVSQGQKIGEVGSTGFSTGPHLHFETRENGKLVDPLLYLP